MAKKRYRKNRNDAPFKVVSPAPAQPDAAAADAGDDAPGRAPQNGGGGDAQKSAATPKKQKEFFYLPADKRSLWPTEIAHSAQQPYRLIERKWREEIPHMFAVFFMVLLLYGFTTPHKVTLEDDGLFIANLEFFGVAHPPGYPVHTFLGGIFYHLLPFGSPAFKGHFFSGFAGAVACAGLYAVTCMITRGRVFAYLAGLAYGASKTFWSQAIIAESYTLNSAFFFIILPLCVYYAAHVGRSGQMHRRLLFVIAFVYGLATANHYPILFLGSTGLGLLVWSQLFKNILPNFFKAFALLALGALPPYAWMVWRSYDLTPANFYGPIESFDSFIFYVLRTGYAGVDKQENVGWEDKVAFSKLLGDEMLWQFTPVGFALAVVGFLVMARSRYQWLWLSLAVSYFTSSILLIFLLDFQASFIWLAAFRVYHLLAYGIMAIWLAFGAAWVVDKSRLVFSFFMRRQLALFLTAAVAAGAVYAHWEVNNRSDYRWAHDLAMAKINSVEPNSILFTFDDLDLPVGYLHYVEGVRPDLVVYNDQGLVYGNRLFPPLIPDYAPAGNPAAESKSAILRRLARESRRPIYFHPQREKLYKNPEQGSDLTGFYRRVNAENAHDRIFLSDLLRKWLSENIGLEDEITDLWTRQQHHSTVYQLINTLLLAESSGLKLDDKWMEILDRAQESNAVVRIVINLRKMHTYDEKKLRRELEWTGRADIGKEDLLDDKMKSYFYILRANLIKRLQEAKDGGGVTDEDYEDALLRGLRQYKKAADHPALPLVLNHYLQGGRHCDFIRTAERFYPSPDDMPTEMLRNLRQARQKADNCAPAPSGS